MAGDRDRLHARRHWLLQDSHHGGDSGSEDGGSSWNRLARGLPKKESFFTVQRDAMDIDEAKSPALYFGTTTGQLWIGRDGGEEWSCLFDSLPPIHCLKVAVV